ncbi:MAG: sugar ABC transporter permease [Rhodoglobus sp.]
MSVAPDFTRIPAAEPATLRGYVRDWILGLRNGNLGALPIVIGLVVIAIVFQSLNSNFLTAGNFVNLMVQGAAMATLAMGIVFVLLIGEIDLSVGYVSGVCGVLVALFLTPGDGQVPTPIALLAAVVAGAAIGAVHGILISKLKIPSFVVTLAGFLAWNGVVLLLIGSRGSIIIQDKLVISLTSQFLLPAIAWGLMALAVVGYAAVQLVHRSTRRRNGLSADPLSIVALRVGALVLFGSGIVLIANLSRGIPYVFVLVGVLFLLWTFVLNRTRFGLSVYAVGGSIEAARRAGINTDRVRIACFMIASSMAAIGGVILASRLRSVDSNVGGGSLLLYSIAAAVIGGTSLFGGRGSARSALLGALVIASIDNGLGLLGLGSGQKFVITGLVLLTAVAVDALSRRGRVTGRL